MRDSAGIPFGQYTLSRRIARGGMAEVFLARQSGPEGFDRYVAIKRILPHLADTSNFVSMFLDEARLAARLSHPNIVHIYEFGKVAEHFFIAMEYVGGVHAGVLIKQGAQDPVPFEIAARIGADACAGLHYAHQLTDVEGNPLRVVHRDVSPQNLMVSPDGVVKLVDFGIAKARSHMEKTRPGVVKGKYAYMSPEQTRGKKLDGRSDVFSLAVVLWELIAGRIAIDRSDPVALMKTIRDGKFPDIRTVRPDTPPALVDALAGAMRVNIKERSTAYELGSRLEEFLKASPRMATSMQVAEYIRERFPRAKTTGSQSALPSPGTRQATVQATRATAAATGLSMTGIEVDDSQMTEITKLPPAYISARPSRSRKAVKRRRWRIAAAAGATVALGATLMLFLGRDDGSSEKNAARASVDAGVTNVVTVDAAVVAKRVVDAAPKPVDAQLVVKAPADAAPAIDAAPKRAIVEVVTRPKGALVILGKVKKRSPAKFKDIAPGKWKLRISKRGFKTITRDLDVKAGQQRTLEYPLARARVFVARKRYGRLTVRTRPYSVVYMGGRRLGMTPFADKSLPVGSHLLTFRNPKRRAYKRRVRIRQGATTRLNFRLPR